MAGLGLGLGLNLAPHKPAFSVPGLPNYSAGMRNVLSNTADVDILHIGNSTVAGAGNGPTSTPAGLDGNAAAYAPATVLATLLSTGFPASSHTLNGTSRLASTATYNAYDNAATFTGTVTPTTNNALVGGGYFGLGVGGATTFNIVDPCDRLTLSTDTATAGLADIKVGGITVATMNAVTAAFQTVTLPPGTTSVTVEGTSGNFRFVHLHGRSTTVKRVYTNRLGQAGRMLSTYITSTGQLAVKALITAVQPKLVIFDSWINEGNAGQLEAAYKAAFQDGITAAKAAGSDVLLFGGHYVGSNVLRAQYMTWLSDLSVLNDVPFLDLATTSPNWASLAAATSAGYMTADAVHLTTAGAAAKAAAIYDRITP